ncbi:EscJ/YscJ/HrcJ family type III secretion inner membrane ring protein [Candidatus Neptunichlamydia sp. REUL1]|uniref:EscJ/YscJ/HrcJ family type III secretion inner membrane ring protein n=1 Tax=Candidatus Neptunichlamydia sp. REUL1 TaxID=3064277 RepID=UPI00292E9C31|nr:EscJ/YscJ/HrcJ family type III secretion inner membrane ring protein [Candidatus Neptunochlamydia sp. REUL1]
MRKIIRSVLLLSLMGSFLVLFTGCDNSREVVSNVSEKEANITLVLLESKGIPAMKQAAATSGIGAEGSVSKYSIMVPEKYSIEAIAYLNQNGFPREKGTTLLELFAKQGLMTSDKEETIRYQAGLAQQLTNTILMIDGVIEANVQISFPPEDTGLGQSTEKKQITAAVYVKHQGVIDDPNIHLENKIKRLISGSVTGLDINNVTVVSDRSRFTDITLEQMPESLGGKPGEYVSVWNIVMSKNSVSRFRVLFFIITFIAVLLAIVLGWISWKFYPQLKKKGGLKELFNPIPLINTIRKKPPSEPPGEGGV